MKNNAVAFSNNDVITMAWSYSKKPTGCMGFTIYRIDEKNNEDPLPSQAVFKGQKKTQTQTTTVKSPVQKFYWKDVYARLIAEDTGKRKFKYKIVPRKEGTNGKLIDMNELPTLFTNEVEILPQTDSNIAAFFNRGLISTQRIAREFKGSPSKSKLLDRIKYKTKDKLRDSLSGDMVEALTGFIGKAEKSGKIYAALYELGDEELIDKLKGLKNRLYIILSDSKIKEDDFTKPQVKGKDGKMHYPQKTADGNESARNELKKIHQIHMGQNNAGQSYRA